jgi:hypothetical protein
VIGAPSARRWRVPGAKDLLGAVLVAFGAIFQPKARPEDHWSTRPGIELVTEFEADEASGAAGRRRRLPATA